MAFCDDPCGNYQNVLGSSADCLSWVHGIVFRASAESSYESPQKDLWESADYWVHKNCLLGASTPTYQCRCTGHRWASLVNQITLEFADLTLNRWISESPVVSLLRHFSHVISRPPTGIVCKPCVNCCVNLLCTVYPSAGTFRGHRTDILWITCDDFAKGSRTSASCRAEIRGKPTRQIRIIPYGTCDMYRT